jgi:YD repeat-containing protein
VVQEVDNSGNVLVRYAQIPIDEHLAQVRSGTTNYYEQGGVGSVTSLSNTAGGLANTYTYDSYGKLSASTGTISKSFLYTGRESDPETGLVFEDPLHFRSGSDFYVYVSNSPNLFRDPSGLALRNSESDLRERVAQRGESHSYIGL